MYTEAIGLGTGLSEGGVFSPRISASRTRTLIEKLQASGLGVRAGGVWCGVPMLMDDVLLLPTDSTRRFGAMFS